MVNMKLSIFLLSCLLVGTLAKPRSEVEERPKRNSEAENSNDSFSLQSLIAGLPGNLPTVLRELPGDLSDITSSVAQIISGETPMESVMSNIQRFLKQINPLSSILNSIPIISTIYNVVIRFVSIPITIVANIVSLILRIIGKILPGFSLSGL
ncbi:uncharacterized protein LOC100881358 [Megachile rotundata]|uniref:uncharacterized protein LOC100881358 n=1 Tax=Megachile rotundata TaxID=143995 RepID=UPI003FD31352